MSNNGNEGIPFLTTISTDSELDYEVMTSLTFDVIATNLCDPEDEVREAEVDEDSRLTVVVQVYTRDTNVFKHLRNFYSFTAAQDQILI